MPRSANHSETAAEAPLAYLLALQHLSEDELLGLRATTRSTASDLLDLADLAAEHSQIQHRLSTASAPVVAALRDIAAGTAPDPTGFLLARRLLLAHDAGADGRPALLPGVQTTLEAEPSHPRPKEVQRGPVLTPAAALVLGQRLLVQGEAAPLPLIADGRLSMSEATTLGALTDTDPVLIRTLTEVLERAGLLLARGRQLVPAAEAHPWMEAPAGRRWGELCASSTPSAPLRQILRNWDGPAFSDLVRTAEETWPLGQDWLEPELDRLRQHWEVLGVLDEEAQVRPEGHELLAGRTPALSLPAPSETAYLQDDLRVVVPGVAHPRLAAFLRRIATPLNLAQAETYEITQATMAGALRGEATGDSLLATLERISPTGVPQPLRYLVTRTAEELRRLQISPTGAGTLLRCDTPALAETLAVDSALRRLRLERISPNELRTGATPDRVLDALQEAHYPASVALPQPPQAGGPTRGAGPRTPEPHRAQAGAAPQTPEEPAPFTPLRDLPQERILDWALHHRVAVSATVALPGGKTITQTLMPRSLSHNRLRASDPGTEVERTLPLSAVTSLHIEGVSWDH